MSSLLFENVSKSFGKQKVIDSITLEVKAGEMFSLLGPSGCGKTTLLRLASGLEQPDSGSVWLDGRDITALPPEARPVNTIFQSYALFPHLSARENIAFGPKLTKQTAADIRARVAEMLELVQLQEHADKLPSQLSGGQKQRVAIARALINRPRVLLLDEPLAALDLKLRQHMLSELKRLHQSANCTFLFVTHDQTEAMGLSDRLAVMNQGRVIQIGPPETLYSRPNSEFVASFIGHTNLIPGTLTSCEGADFKCRVAIAGLGEVHGHSDSLMKVGTQVKVSIRPEDCLLTPAESPRPDSALPHKFIIEEMLYLGAKSQATLRSVDHTLTVSMPTGSVTKGREVWLSFRTEAARVLGC
jgi:spermidine/putrescine transport system ATP-binding protein